MTSLFNRDLLITTRGGEEDMKIETLFEHGLVTAIEHDFGAIDSDIAPNGSDKDRLASKNANVDMFKGCMCCSAPPQLVAGGDGLLHEEDEEQEEATERVLPTRRMSEEEGSPLKNENIIVEIVDSYPTIALDPLPKPAPENAFSVVSSVVVDEVLAAPHLDQQPSKTESFVASSLSEEERGPEEADTSSTLCLCETCLRRTPFVIGHLQPLLSCFWAKAASPIAVGFVKSWIKSLLYELGDSIVRHRGVLNVKGSDRKYIVHGDHMTYQGRFTSFWASTELRESKFVFVGRNLPLSRLEKEFQSLSARELRFSEGERVMANVGKFKLGTVVKQWDDGNAYRIRLDNRGGEVFAPLDTIDYVHSTELRFAVGWKVLANVGKFELGTVLKHWDDGNAYRIRLDSTGENVWGPVDTDDYIKDIKSLRPTLAEGRRDK
jgi:G3E family GTPase